MRLIALLLLFVHVTSAWRAGRVPSAALRSAQSTRDAIARSAADEPLALTCDALSPRTLDAPPMPCARTTAAALSRRAAALALLTLVLGSDAGGRGAAALAASSDSIGRGTRATGNVRDGALDIDQALGILWGGRDRCDANDPLCGAEGVLRDAPPAAAPVPRDDAGEPAVDAGFRAYLDFDVAGAPADRLSFGLYPSDPAAPDGVAAASAAAFRALCDGTLRPLCDGTPSGRLCDATQRLNGGYSAGWAMGTELRLDPNAARRDTIALAQPDQAAAYARRRGLRKAPADFEEVRLPKFSGGGFFGGGGGAVPGARPHDRAGLLTVAVTGPGDALAFEVTLRAAPALDRDHVVIGRLLDDGSMALLSRLGALPARKNLGNSGTPIVRVVVRNAGTEVPVAESSDKT